MSKRRREWKESLKQVAESDTVPEKREKIQIISDETYKNVEGKMILVSTETNKVEMNNNTTILHQTPQKFNVDNLTPTFRKPDDFIAKTKEVMKSITPIKLFPVASETQCEEEFTMIPGCSTERDEKNGDFIHLNNIASVLSEFTHEANCFAETLSPDREKLPKDNSCSFTIQIEVEHKSSLDKNDNAELISAKINATVETSNEYPDSEMKTSDEINIYENEHFGDQESMNIIENYNNTEAVESHKKDCNSDETNIENNSLEQPMGIVVYAEIHNQPNKCGSDKKYENVIVIKSHKLDDDELIIIPEDKPSTSNIPSCEALDAAKANETEEKYKVKRTRKNIPYNKSYLDYMSDEDLDQLLLDEAFPSEGSTEESYPEESSDDEDEDKKIKKKKKKGKKKAKKNVKKRKSNEIQEDHNISAEKKTKKSDVRVKNKKKKAKGETYNNDKGELIEGKSIKPNPCIRKKCGNDCQNIPEERRQSLFTYFWNLNSNQRRKDWIAHCAVKKSLKRPSKANNTRNCSYDYFINEGEGRRKVCQQYLINTLDITQRFILYTLDTMTDGYAKTDARGKNGGYNKTKEQVIEHGRNFIESLPKMPSHYCRKDSTRLYFPEEFKNVSNLYRIYRDNCKHSLIKGMSYQVFIAWFRKSYNIGFHVPKKDKCIICTDNKNKEEKTEEENEKMERHVKEKNESYKRFKYHQTIHGKDKSIISTPAN